jgi:hypothetical protein
MESSVVPLRMVAFQTLFLLMAIAIEGYVLRRRLTLTPRASIEYAATVNLLSTLIGWLVFFGFQPLFPANLKLQLMGYIFYDQWSGDLASLVIPAGIVTFFVSFFVKLQGFIQLQSLRQERKPSTDSEQAPLFANLKRGQPEIARQASAVLLANSLSYSAISLVLLLRLAQFALS